MKVIVPVINNSDRKYEIATGFHKTECMCICDSDENTYEWVNTEDICEFISDFASELYLRDVEAVISKAMPFNALGLFLERGLDVFQANGSNLEENIKLLTEDKLFAFSPTAVSQMSSCVGICTTCESNCED